MKLMLSVSGGKSLLYHRSVHWTDSFKTSILKTSWKQAKLKFDIVSYNHEINN